MPTYLTERQITARVEVFGSVKAEVADRRRFADCVRWELRGLPCAYCRGYGGQVDHKIPIAQGGTSDPDNLTSCCSRCNLLKGDYTPEQFRRWYQRDIGPWPPLSFAEQLLASIDRPLTPEQMNKLIDGIRWWRGLRC